MATSSGGFVDRAAVGQSWPLVAAIGVCTVALTTAFVGIMAVASGNATGILGRLPVYVLVSSIAFVGVLLTVDGRYQAGTAGLVQAAAAGVGEFVLLLLATEGVLHAVRNPEAVVASHLFVYLLSAAVIASGLGYWAVRNWQEVRGVVGDAPL